MKLNATRSKELIYIHWPHKVCTALAFSSLKKFSVRSHLSSKNVLCELCREFAQKNNGIVCAFV